MTWTLDDHERAARLAHARSIRMNSTMNGPRSGTVAYFSMEICLEPKIPTYSGGLGVLAGDTLRSAADLRVPLVAVTLLHRKGYFEQRLGEGGQQVESPS